MKNRIGFVILHYLAYEMTKKSVESIIEKLGNEAVIVIVDNASPDQSGKKLEKDYEGTGIKVIINDTNLGFARGNNTGYKFLKDNYSLEYIVVMNNDVLIVQNDFLAIIDEVWNRTHFEVCGPDIYNPITKAHQNPHRESRYTLSDVENRLRIIQSINRRPLFTYIIHNTFGRLKKQFIHKKPVEYREELIGNQFVLHGAFYIFNKSYISLINDCFDPRTFLYFEEDILAEKCHKMGLKTVYAPALVIHHYEDVSTNQALKTQYRKFRFKNSEMEKSCAVLLSVMRA